MARKRARRAQGRAKAPSGPARLSLRAFAAQARITNQALSKAVKSGRLLRSLGRTPAGKPFIADPALALEELRENAAQAPNNGGRPGPPRPGQTLSEAQREVAVRRARQLELANATREGRLVDRATYERRSLELAMTVRDAMLAIPDRVASELAAEMGRERVHARLREEIRIALGALADAFEKQAEQHEAEDLALATPVGAHAS